MESTPAVVTERSCNTCEHHVQGIVLSTKCYECFPHLDLPNWKPIAFHAEPKLNRKEYAGLHGTDVPTTALNTQVGGSHYKDLKIQPIEFIHANQIPFCEANVIKYVCRWKAKNGIKDLEKAKHYIELLIDLEANSGSF